MSEKCARVELDTIETATDRNTIPFTNLDENLDEDLDLVCTNVLDAALVALDQGVVLVVAPGVVRILN